ncbi:hypothetical protein DFH09DRAFT_1085719 [Mycena vulgaris]|nr:hypothetical protein DFH09DRAFT_1085719 [Mycena vulgaris]
MGELYGYAQRELRRNTTEGWSGDEMVEKKKKGMSIAMKSDRDADLESDSRGLHRLEENGVLPDINLESARRPPTNALDDVWWDSGFCEGRSTARAQGLTGDVLGKLCFEPCNEPTASRHRSVEAQPELMVQREEVVARGNVGVEKMMGVGPAGCLLNDDGVAFVEAVGFVVGEEECEVVGGNPVDGIGERHLTKSQQPVAASANRRAELAHAAGEHARNKSAVAPRADVGEGGFELVADAREVGVDRAGNDKLSVSSVGSMGSAWSLQKVREAESNGALANEAIHRPRQPVGLPGHWGDIHQLGMPPALITGSAERRRRRGSEGKDCTGHEESWTKRHEAREERANQTCWQSGQSGPLCPVALQTLQVCKHLHPPASAVQRPLFQLLQICDLGPRVTDEFRGCDGAKTKFQAPAKELRALVIGARRKEAAENDVQIDRPPVDQVGPLGVREFQATRRCDDRALCRLGILQQQFEDAQSIRVLRLERAGTSNRLLNSRWGRASALVALTRTCVVRWHTTCATISGTPLLLIVVLECFEERAESRFDVENVPNSGAQELLVNFVEGSRFDDVLMTVLVNDDLTVSEGSLNGRGLLAGSNSIAAAATSIARVPARTGLSLMLWVAELGAGTADTAWVPARTGLSRVLWVTSLSAARRDDLAPERI